MTLDFDINITFSPFLAARPFDLFISFASLRRRDKEGVMGPIRIRSR